jgi:TrmH family RNA methyltransferase
MLTDQRLIAPPAATVLARRHSARAPPQCPHAATVHSDAVTEITSPTNPRVKGLVGLRKRTTREAVGATLIEGYDEIRLAVDAGVRVATLFHCRAMHADRDPDGVLRRLGDSGAEVVSLSTAAFVKASYRESPDGWLAVVPRPDRSLHDLRLSEEPLVLIAEGVEKPGNLGAMLRTAEAAGVEAVVSVSPGTDWGNPNVVRASKGTVFVVPVASASTAETLNWLRGKGLRVVVATPEADDLVTDADLGGPVAIVVGAEHEGVTSAWTAAADVVVRIPMSGRVNSLNVATSAALVVYEAVRQRRRAAERQR